jgi:hypothetical protein
MDTFEGVVSLIVNQIRSGCQAFHVVVGPQGDMVFKMATMLKDRLNESARDHRQKYEELCWDPKNGLTARNLKTATQPPHINPVAALSAIMDEGTTVDDKPNFVCLMLDLPSQTVGNEVLASGLRRAIVREELSNGTFKRPLIMVSVRSVIHPDLPAYVKYHELPYPNKEELKTAVSQLLDSNTQLSDTGADLRERYAEASMGLSLAQSKDALGASIIGQKGATEKVCDLILDEKAKVLRQVSGLEYVSAETVSKSELGGYGNVKKWIQQRVEARNHPAVVETIGMPKGVAFYGIPGTGKSIAARVIAKSMGAALVRLDVSALYGSLVGQTEQRLRDAIRAVSAIGKCVLLLDEVDKLLGGSHEASGDSGVSRRALGTILTWMAEKQDWPFVVATLNRVDGLPPELLRRGRFDEMFFVDLPTPSERKDILDIHLRKRNIWIAETGIKDTIRALDLYSGAEIEQVVIDAVYAAAAKNDLVQGKTGKGYLLPYHYITEASKAVRPLAKIDKDGVDSIRKFGMEKFTAAAEPEEPQKAPSGRQFSLSSET